MHSLRRSLTSYLLALLVVTLAVVGIVIDQVTGRSLEARQTASRALIEAQFVDRCRDERLRMDDELLQEARKLGREFHKEYVPRFQKDFARFNLTRALIAYGPGQPLLTSVFLANPALYFGHLREFFSRLPIDEGLLRSVEDPEKTADYYQIFSASGRASWRSESLLGDSLPFMSVEDWSFNESELIPSKEPVRRVVMRVSLNNPPSLRSRLRPGGPGGLAAGLPGVGLNLGGAGGPGLGGVGPGGPGPGSRGPSSGVPGGLGGGRPGSGPMGPGPRPSGFGPLGARPAVPQIVDENLVVFVQCARPIEPLLARLEAYEQERDSENDTVAGQIREERRQLRASLLVIGLVTFLGIAVGGPLLVSLGLRPLRDLSQAVSQVSEKDFKLPHDGAGLPLELRAIHERLTQTLGMLRRAFAREKQAVADISHELRTPIASLQATFDVALRKPRTPEQYRTTLEECRLINKQLGQLVERIMTLASLDSGNDQVDTILVDASEIAASCAAVIRPLAISHGLELNVDVESPLELETDPDKLREVLMNLLHNAIEYNRPSGLVEMRGWREADSIHFEIRDTGIGMTPEIRERIFERFFRADLSRHATGVHAGLGLAIVQEYVDRLHGTIAVESEVGQGSCFRIVFPAPHDAEPAGSASTDRVETLAARS